MFDHDSKVLFTVLYLTLCVCLYLVYMYAHLSYMELDFYLVYTLNQCYSLKLYAYYLKLQRWVICHVSLSETCFETSVRGWNN